MIQTQLTSIQNQAIPMTRIDPNTIAKHGDSPTAIILAIAILLSTLLTGITGLVQVLTRERK